MSISTTSSHPYATPGGQGFGLLPRLAECAVSEAARFLDMSEGCINGLLVDGLITHRLENGERLVQWDSLLEFESEYREQRKAMAEITRTAQEMGLYD